MLFPRACVPGVSLWNNQPELQKKENVEKNYFTIVKVRMKTLNTCDSRRNLEAHKDNNHS